MTVKHLALDLVETDKTAITPQPVNPHPQEYWVSNDRRERRGIRVNPEPRVGMPGFTGTSNLGATVRIDHRQGRRCNLIALAEIRFRGGQQTSAVIANISANGMFIITEAKLTANECVDIQITHPDVAQPELRFPGLVVHTKGNGFGMIFRELDDAALNHLNWWLSEK